MISTRTSYSSQLPTQLLSLRHPMLQSPSHWKPHRIENFLNLFWLLISHETKNNYEENTHTQPPARH